MNSLFGHSVGVMIVIIMAAFIGIWIWAWRPRHRSTFDRLSQIPMEDPPEPTEESTLKDSDDSNGKTMSDRVSHQTGQDDKGNGS